jgi:hypothetical protein
MHDSQAVFIVIDDLASQLVANLDQEFQEGHIVGELSSSAR